MTRSALNPRQTLQHTAALLRHRRAATAALLPETGRSCSRGGIKLLQEPEGLVWVQEGLVWVQEGLIWVQEGFVPVQEGYVWIQEGLV